MRDYIRDNKAELLGTFFAALGFGLIANGFLGLGFVLGIVSGFFFMPLFYTRGLYATFTLQGYFFGMNLLGLYYNI